MKYEEKAKQFAYKAHEGQLRKDGVTPYIEHPKAVVGILKNAGIADDTILSAAWLHDVVEDCNVSLSTVRAEFSGEIAELVDGMTQREHEGETDDEYRQRIARNNNQVKMVKLADVLHNMRTTSTARAEKRMKIYNSMSSAWNVYKGFAYEVCPELARLIDEAFKNTTKHLEV
ncbi:HD domain-containing protein [archaeon]|nr:HD domain-containing protein [archaeon]